MDTVEHGLHRKLTVLAVSGLPQWNFTVYLSRKLTGSGQVGGGTHCTDSFLPGITITLTFTGGSGFTAEQPRTRTQTLNMSIKM